MHAGCPGFDRLALALGFGSKVLIGGTDAYIGGGVHVIGLNRPDPATETTWATLWIHIQPGWTRTDRSGTGGLNLSGWRKAVSEISIGVKVLGPRPGFC